MNNIKVGVTAIIRKGNEFLLGVKNRPTKYYGKIVTVGGGLEYKENPFDGIKREIFEEANIQVSHLIELPSISLVEEDRQIIFICFECFYLSGEVIPKDDIKDLFWHNLETCLTMDYSNMTYTTQQLFNNFICKHNL